MKQFQPALKYEEGLLSIDGVSLLSLADKFKTPLFIYSGNSIQKSIDSIINHRPGEEHLICFSVKSNSNLAILKLMNKYGVGADVVSGGELFRALRAMIPPNKIVFSGVGKTDKEINEALDADILLFNVESPAELRSLSRIAQDKGLKASIGIRVNPDIDAKTHPYITTGLNENKFGLSLDDAVSSFKLAKDLPALDPIGISIHIGSQIISLDPFRKAAESLLQLYRELTQAGFCIKYIDVGGGLGIQYQNENVPLLKEYLELFLEKLHLPGVKIIFEPGRSIIGNAGYLLTRILYNKINRNKKFYICDAAINDLCRPSFYGAFHMVIPVIEDRKQDIEPADLVGPICESGDFLARNRILPQFVAGDLGLIGSVGAYGFSMSSNYNSRTKAAEILISSGSAALIRKRESYEDLIRGEVDPLLQDLS